MLQGIRSENRQELEPDGKQRDQHQAEPEPGDRSKYEGNDHHDAVQPGVLPYGRYDSHGNTQNRLHDHGQERQKKRVGEPCGDRLDDRLPGGVGSSQVKMQHNVFNIIKEPYKERPVVSEFFIEPGNILRFGSDSKHNGSRIAGCQGKDGKDKERYAQQDRDHIQNPFDHIFRHKNASFVRKRPRRHII